MLGKPRWSFRHFGEPAPTRPPLRGQLLCMGVRSQNTSHWSTASPVYPDILQHQRFHTTNTNKLKTHESSQDLPKKGACLRGGGWGATTVSTTAIGDPALSASSCPMVPWCPGSRPHGGASDWDARWRHGVWVWNRATCGGEAGEGRISRETYPCIH